MDSQTKGLRFHQNWHILIIECRMLEIQRTNTTVVIPKKFFSALHACTVGVEYHYSTNAWTLVGALIERVSNESFLHYMKHNLFTPLGMEATKGEFNDTLLNNKTRCVCVCVAVCECSLSRTVI